MRAGSRWLRALACLGLVIGTGFAHAAQSPGELRRQMLQIGATAEAGAPEVAEVTSGRRDADFGRYDFMAARLRQAPFWVRLEPGEPPEGAGTVAAVILEPVIGGGGVFPAPDGYLQRIREICDTHGVLMIVDEVITGFGRTGTLFYSEHAGIRPDMMKRGAVRSIYDGRYVFTRYFSPKQHNRPATLEDLYKFNDVELFDAVADPNEMNNLAGAGSRQRDLVAAMNDKLNRLIDTEVGEDRGQMLPGGIDAGWEVTPETMAGA